MQSEKKGSAKPLAFCKHPFSVAAFDLDGTLLKKNGSFAFCRFLCKKGLLSRLDLAICALIYLRHCYFGLSLHDLHQQVFDRFFRGVSQAHLQIWIEPFLSEQLNTLWYSPALLRLKALQQEGIECIIFSNSPRFLVQAIARKIGVEKVFATEYQINDKGELIGIATLMDGLQKAKILQQIASKTTMALSDSPLDLPFLEAAKMCVAVNPKRALRKIAQKKGWEIL